MRIYKYFFLLSYNLLAGVKVLDDEDRDAVAQLIRETHGAVDESTGFDVGPD